MSLVIVWLYQKLPLALFEHHLVLSTHNTILIMQ